jgi:glycosyltransferase involved in cell wall biosynthesis
MKLAYLLSEYPTLGHTYLLREVRQLRDLGWEIQTISVRKPQARTSALLSAETDELSSTWYILDDGALGHLKSHLATLATHPLRYVHGLVTALRFGSYHPRRTGLALAYFAEAVWTGDRLKRAGITHLHSVYSTTVALILSRVFDVHLSMTLHGPAEFTDPEGFAIHDKVRAAEVVCAISYFGRSQIMLWSAADDWHKLYVTPLGVDSTGWKLAEFREKPETFELISAGRLADIKGFPLMLEAIAELCKQGRVLRLTLAGDGPSRAELEEQARRLGIENCVLFSGWRNQEELRELYTRSDLFIMSSFAEGVPVVLMEAMAIGLPCVAPRINGIPELIRNEEDGLLFAAANVSEMARAIARMMDDTEMRRRMAESSRAQVANKYNLGKNVEKLAAVLGGWMSKAD